MKKSLFLFTILSGFLLSSCNLEKCSCNTFGMKKNVQEKHTVTASSENEVAKYQ